MVSKFICAIPEIHYSADQNDRTFRCLPQAEQKPVKAQNSVTKNAAQRRILSKKIINKRSLLFHLAGLQFQRNGTIF